MKKLSVIIATRNRPKELLACLVSLKNQTDKNFEIVVIDDGSSLKSINALKMISKKFKNVKFLLNKSNEGVSFSRNLGINHAQGEIIAFLDDDALADKQWVISIKSLFSSDKSLIGLCGKILPKKKEESSLTYKNSNYLEKIETIIQEGNCAFRKSVLKKVDGWDERLFGHEGLDLSIRLKKEFPNSYFLYSPQMIIYHDFAKPLIESVKKQIRHGRALVYLNKKHKLSLNQNFKGYLFSAYLSLFPIILSYSILFSKFRPFIFILLATSLILVILAFKKINHLKTTSSAIILITYLAIFQYSYFYYFLKSRLK